MQIESVLQTKNRSEPAKNRFSVALINTVIGFITVNDLTRFMSKIFEEILDKGEIAVEFALLIG